jgi:glycosyltransferase involved in cell wall biosynthesis
MNLFFLTKTCGLLSPLPMSISTLTLMRWPLFPVLFSSLSLPHSLHCASGTLVMAMGLGIPCLSTPYPFAREMFQDHRGVLVPFRDSTAITRGLGYLLDDEERARRIGKRGREITVNWNEVGRRYLELVYPASHSASGG